jgi:hypothetical protein
MIHLLLLSPNNEYKNEILPLNKGNAKRGIPSMDFDQTWYILSP